MTNYVQVILEIFVRKYPEMGVCYRRNELRMGLEYYKNMHLPKPAIEAMIDQKINFCIGDDRFKPTHAKYESVDLRSDNGLLKLYFEKSHVITPSYLLHTHKKILNEGFYPKCKDAKYLDKYGGTAVDRICGKPQYCH